MTIAFGSWRSCEVVSIIVGFRIAHPRLAFHAFAGSLVVAPQTSPCGCIRLCH